MHTRQWFVIATICILFAACTGQNKTPGTPVVTKERTAEIDRGRYLIEIMGCNDCHTSDAMGGGSYLPEEEWLTGGSRGFHGPWGTAYPTNLRLLLNSISEEEWLVLAKSMRRNSPMAWSWLPKVTDQDLRAMYRFVRYLGPKGAPAPPRLPPGVTPKTDYINFPLPH